MQVYFDNSATTRTCQKSINAVMQAMSSKYGNPSSLHRMGFEAENILRNSRKQIASFLGCDDQELYFTSGATESNNLAILGCAYGNRRKKHLVTTAVEHPSVMEAFKHLETEGYEVTYLKPGKNGTYVSSQFEEAVREDTLLVSCMMVNNETGSRFPINEIARAVKRKQPNVVFHTDVVQAFGKLPLSIKKIPVDLVSISGHKLYAPKGIGGLFIRKGVRIRPLQYGGGQEKSIRPGTESIPLISGFAAAVEHVRQNKNELLYTRLNQHLQKRLKLLEQININSPKDSVDYILNFSVMGIRSEIMLHFLEEHDIYVSSGSACSKGKKSSVLLAMGLDLNRIDTAIRVSFGLDNTLEQVDKFVQCLKMGLNNIVVSK